MFDLLTADAAQVQGLAALQPVLLAILGRARSDRRAAVDEHAVQRAALRAQLHRVNAHEPHSRGGGRRKG
eukprot:106476-Alexandrium_andersonii.AAC.1